MGTAVEKLKYLNETKAEIKNALETPYNVMRDYPELIKKYIDNQPTKVVTDGICGNAVDVPVKAIEINGNIRQETTEGYNLLNVPAEYTVLSTENNKEVPISLKANTKYTIKIGSINTDNTDVTKVLFRFRYKKADISNPYAYVKLSDLKLVYTPASDVDAVWIYSGNGYVESSKTNTTYKNLMIYEGTDDKPYEPYTGGIPSPSPDYPQEITNVGENGIKIKQSGKNLFDKSAVTKGYELNSRTGQLLSNNDWYTSDYIEVNNLNKIHLSSTGKTGGNGNCFYDKDKKFIKTRTGINNVSLSVPENAYYLRFNGLITQLDNDIQIEKGTEATSYEPYHNPIITPINLQGNILSKAREVKDILRVKRNGEVEIKKNTWEETINGSDLITLSNNNKALAFYPSKKKVKGERNDDYLVTNAQRNRTLNDGTVYQNAVNFVFVGNPTDTLETIKAKFNGGKILYQLATPQIITLPSISPIELWQGTNIFSLVTNLDTEIELEYIVDKDSVLNEVQTAMLEAEI